MGASQSYQKTTTPAINYNTDIDDLSSFLNRTFPSSTSPLSTDLNFNTRENTENSNKLNEPSKEIITNLENQYNGQTAEIKKINEYRDLLNHDLNVIKNKINKNNKINYNLLIFIILLVIILIPLIALVIVKFVNV